MKKFCIQRENPKVGEPQYEFIPYAFMEQFEERAKKNHSDQSIPVLNKRYGLSWKEALACVRDVGWEEVQDMREIDAKHHVLIEVVNWFMKEYENR